MKESSQRQVSIDYIKLLDKKIREIFPLDATQAEIAFRIGIGKNTFNNLFKNQLASIRILDQMASYLRVLDYKSYLKRKRIMGLIEERLFSNGGHWISYRLNSNRRLYESVWKFERTYQNILEKDTSGSLREIKHATKYTSNNEFSGEIYFNSDLTIEILVQSNNAQYLRYFTVFFEDKEDDFYNSFEYLVFEVIYLEGNEEYTQLEVFVQAGDLMPSPKLMRNTFIPFDPDADFMPTNHAYLAFNYLTRNGSKSRRVIDNWKVNQVTPMGYKLNYHHNIFISCPISYLDTQEEFDQLKKGVEDLKEVLIAEFGFHESNIYCELSEYNSLNDIPYDTRHLYFKVRQLIPATHYIALVPADLGNFNSAIYMEIYFRIQNKLPGVIFVEKRANLPSLLFGLTEANDKPVNIAFRDCDIENVAEYLLKTRDFVFQYTL